MREKILTFIEKNSRIDIKELAIILGEDELSVANELAAMEADHVICGYHTLINWDKTDIEKVTALIEVSVTPQRGQGFDKIAERIYNYPEVNAVYLISGSYDLLVTIEGRTLREAAQFVSARTSMSMVINVWFPTRTSRPRSWRPSPQATPASSRSRPGN